MLGGGRPIIEGMDQDHGQIDTAIRVVTPENIAFRYTVAGPFRRLVAYLLDLLIRFAVAWAGMMAVGFMSGIIGLPGLGFGMAAVLIFALIWFYGGLFEAFWNGQTPGKRALKIRVVTVDGQPVNAFQAILRNVLRAIDCQPFPFYQVGLWSASLNDRFQRLGDLACGTMVVLDEPNWFFGMMRVDEPEAIRLASQIPANFQTPRSLARSLAAYVQRRRFFPPGRRYEMAGHLGEPLVERLGLPPQTDHDLLLCALYHRTFITDRADDARAAGVSPFAPAAAPPQGRMAGENPFAQALATPEIVEAESVADGGEPVDRRPRRVDFRRRRFS